MLPERPAKMKESSLYSAKVSSVESLASASGRARVGAGAKSSPFSTSRRAAEADGVVAAARAGAARPLGGAAAAGSAAITRRSAAHVASAGAHRRLLLTVGSSPPHRRVGGPAGRI